MVLTPHRLQRIPHAPGVYVFTRRGVPVYVGKAADLAHRLAAYRPNGDWKTDMLAEATGLQCTRTESELEALLLEANWIKTKQPKYNIANREGRSFLYIAITDEEFPQVLATRTFAPSGTYFGPFTSAHAVRETLRALRKIFPFRCSRHPIAPAVVGGVSMQGRSFAPAWRTRSKRSVALPPGAGAVPASLALRPAGQAPLPAGAPRGAKPCLYFHLGQCAGSCAGRVTPEQYRRRVITPLTRFLKGETKSARRMLDADHRLLLDSVLAHTRVLSVTEKYASDLLELQRTLHLPRPPRRIEGYDISNIHGIEAVGSLVVAIDGEPEPSEYKKFKIKTLEGRSNDVGMLTEVLTRRFAHSALAGPAAAHPHRARITARGGGPPLRVTRSRSSMEKEVWPDPDLILIDGGKAQLNAALRAMRRSGVAFPLLALAKREEEIYLPGQRAPLRLPKNAPALHILQRVRDEAHRFAIGYHRRRRWKRMLR